MFFHKNFLFHLKCLLLPQNLIILFIMVKLNLTKKVVVAFLGAMLVVGCSKNESGSEQEQTSSLIARNAEQQSIENTIANFYDCLKKLKPTGFSDFFYDNFFIPAANADSKTWYNFLNDKFKEQYVKTSFDYESVKGTYHWENDKKSWTKTAENQKLELHFPKNSVTEHNNAILVVENYTSINVSTFSLPQTGKFTVTVDGNKVMEVEAKSIRYGFIPTLIEEANIVIYGNPFTTTVDLKRDGKVYNFKSNTSSPDGCVTTVNGVINLTNNNNISTDGIDFKKVAFENFKNLTFDVNYEDLKINVNADIEGLKKLNKEEYSVEEMNTYVKVDVISGGKKVAELKYNKDGNGKYDPDVVFLDGTTEKAEKYFSYFSRKVKHVFRTVFGLE